MLGGSKHSSKGTWLDDGEGVGLFSLLNRHVLFEVEDRLAILAPPIRLGQGYSSEMLFCKP